MPSKNNIVDSRIIILNIFNSFPPSSNHILPLKPITLDYCTFTSIRNSKLSCCDNANYNKNSNFLFLLKLLTTAQLLHYYLFDLQELDLVLKGKSLRQYMRLSPVKEMQSIYHLSKKFPLFIFLV